MGIRIEKTLDLTCALAGLVEAEADKAVQGVAVLIADDIKRRIRSGPKTGRVYGGHQASAPGESPANESGELADSIRVEHKGEGRSEIQVTADHAALLEYGTTKMAPRPFVTPAVEAATPELIGAVAKAVKKAVGG